MNSSIEIAEAVKLARKLIDRTREGKLHWASEQDVTTAESNDKDASREKSFSIVLEGNLKAIVSNLVLGREDLLAFSLVELDPRWLSPIAAMLTAESCADRKILDVGLERNPSFGYDTEDERKLAGHLVDLYALARRSALKIDGSVEKALKYLDNLDKLAV